jgi:hypothetical protein
LKQLIVFDLDGTLAEGKSSLDAGMAGLLDALLEIWPCMGGLQSITIPTAGCLPEFTR